MSRGNIHSRTLNNFKRVQGTGSGLSMGNVHLIQTLQQ
jgi:hypothetical protein